MYIRHTVVVFVNEHKPLPLIPWFQYYIVCVYAMRSSMKACMYPCMCALVAGMGILEKKPLEECNEELKAKFWPTYKVCGVVAWRETVVFPLHSPVLFVQSFQGWS